MPRGTSGCGGCGRAVRGRRRRTCAQCQKYFHIRCANAENRLQFVNMDQTTWLCVDCRSDISEPPTSSDNVNNNQNVETNFMSADDLNIRGLNVMKNFMQLECLINFSIRNDLTLMDEKIFESLFIKLRTNKETLTLGTIYRSPDDLIASNNKFISHLCKTLNHVNKEKTSCIIIIF